VSLPQPIYKDELCIQIPPEPDHSCSLEEIETLSKPSEISSPSDVTTEPCYQLATPHTQPTTVQSRIRDKLFKPLRLPPYLHPYPLNFLEFGPQFSGGDHVIAARHLEAFENFIDQFEIVHYVVSMRLFSNSLFGDVVMWFRGFSAHFIGSWIELSNVFLKYWGENKPLDQYWAEFTVLKRGDEEALVSFNMRFYSVYHSMPLEIRPSETAAMVYYVMAQHPDLVFLLRERKTTSLQRLFEDAEEVEENIWACQRIRDQAFFKTCMYMNNKTMSIF